MTTRVKRPVLRYHGGKWRLAPWIISHFPKHRTYTEVFGGGASVLLRKHRSYAEVYNDKWGIVVNVFQVLRDSDMSRELEHQLRLTPFSRDEFEFCGDEELSIISDPVEKARRTIFRSFASFGSAATNAKHATGFRANSSRSGTTPAHDWMNYPDHISTYTERLKGVVIENKGYADVLRQHDSTETLHYVDPPYVHDTRNFRRGNAAYAHEMTDDDHREMADVLNRLKGMVVLSGYDCELYQELFPDWKAVQRKAKADGARDRVEVLWLNRSCADRQKQLSIFR